MSGISDRAVARVLAVNLAGEVREALDREGWRAAVVVAPDDEAVHVRPRGATSVTPDDRPALLADDLTAAGYRVTVRESVVVVTR